jgi:hypothetical protein
MVPAGGKHPRGDPEQGFSAAIEWFHSHSELFERSFEHNIAGR